jgi:hypothetical protein
MIAFNFILRKWPKIEVGRLGRSPLGIEAIISIWLNQHLERLRQQRSILERGQVDTHIKEEKLDCVRDESHG